ncbi:hypothetical protein B0E45_29845 [Sinorhizobium sp. A49]|uniref:class I SAM-dependent methyltransferase n=1 Tax=Sinorhizobium sp. A49 TaxID=1945861 RepID=UPI000985D795|nr:class I SAM-dependent methyltransferase [Sinorhizobium sp. A49]OOG63098.1 hypothetical protein B0E45_29845 [Sinorhizobium sp. A49]
MVAEKNAPSLASTHWDKRYEEDKRSAWFSNNLVLSELNRRITGADKFWMAWLFDEFLDFKPKKILSIGCGDGAHELVIGRNKWADSVDAFDISPAGISMAAETARRENLNVNFYVDSFDSFIAAPASAKYDVVMFVGSLHHVKELEGMLGKVRDCLTPNGVLIVNEYCGPCYNIYEPSRIAIINGILDALDPTFKLRPDSRWENAALETILDIDPSESVRSALIPVFIRYYFDTCMERQFGGAILHPIFDHLNSVRLNDGSVESVSIVRMLIEIENRLQASGAIPNDFLLGVYQHKTQ